MQQAVGADDPAGAVSPLPPATHDWLRDARVVSSLPVLQYRSSLADMHKAHASRLGSPGDTLLSARSLAPRSPLVTPFDSWLQGVSAPGARPAARRSLGSAQAGGVRAAPASPATPTPPRGFYDATVVPLAAQHAHEADMALLQVRRFVDQERRLRFGR